MFDPVAFVASLPSGPGVYRMLDASGRVLYVGKAKNLRRRVSSYFGARDSLAPRTAHMVRRTASMHATPTATEAEALVLERSLIRSLAPRFNIQFRDDSSYPYLVVTDEEWPRLLVRRQPFSGVREAFGPYPAAARAWRAADMLRKAFRIRDCDDAMFAHRSRPCLQHQMGRCSAPCVGAVDADEYAGQLDDAREVLRGRAAEVRQALIGRMREAAGALDFERAAALRDRVADLAAIAAAQSVDGVKGEDTDVLAVATLHGARLIAVGMLRSGRWMGERFVEPREPDPRSGDDALAATDAELLEAFVASEYEDPRTARPSRLVLPADAMPDAGLVDALAARGLRIARRLSPDMRRWQAMTLDAAALQLRSRSLRAGTQRERAARLAEALGRGALFRIECVDVSHTQGERAVASCVVWEDGMKRSAYRRFDVAPPVPGDDFAAVEEAVFRRFVGGRDGGAALPQLLVVDGGPGQLLRARTALERAGVELQVIGLSKGPRRKVGEEVVHRGPERGPLRLPPSDPALLLLQEIRDEAHRVALAAHRTRRARARLTSPLDAVRGLGPARKEALLHAFGGLAGVQGASVEALARVRNVGPGLARAVWNHFHARPAGAG
ncbi:MAG TPA: excinuclease ABC subunit UvrC [Burkholderiaceae bacterium]|nr:excinuclease ABC subunit UvrC [Burkholderiaceae bacterium]